MKLQTTIITILTTLLLALFISGCSKEAYPIIKDKQVNAISGERVDLVASHADVYSWSQVSGVKVILINANTATLSFIVPDVNETESLVFEVEALMPSIFEDANIRKERATVTVHPLNVLKDDNATNNSNQLKSIALTISNTSLNIDTNTSLNAIATYKDNTTKDITDEVEWINTDSSATQIDSHNLKAKKETNIILQAKLNTITSNAVALEIYQNINGHRLPPEPNKILNDATLLGIDSNNNGVRDDVERWIFEEYKEPIVQAVAMQNARAFGIILVDPSRARETVKFMQNQVDCELYYEYYDSEQFAPKDNELYEESRPLILNTRERSRAYYEYNQALSGGVYLARDSDTYKDSCDFNETKVNRGEW